MNAGQIRRLWTDRDLFLLISGPFDVDGEEMIRVAPIRSRGDTLHGDRDFLLGERDWSLHTDAFVELWNARAVRTSTIGPEIGRVGEEAGNCIREVLRADALGHTPTVPEGLLGTESEDARLGAQQLQRLSEVDAAVTEAEETAPLHIYVWGRRHADPLQRAFLFGEESPDAQMLVAWHSSLCTALPGEGAAAGRRVFVSGHPAIPLLWAQFELLIQGTNSLPRCLVRSVESERSTPQEERRLRELFSSPRRDPSELLVG